MGTNNLKDMSFGKRLSQLRKKRGLSQTGLAKKLGVSQSTLTDYERDIIRLHDSLIVNLSKILKVSTDELLGVKVDSNKKSNHSLRFLRRVYQIEKLPQSKQKALLTTIDAFLKGESID